jgi:hypothetical protein
VGYAAALIGAIGAIAVGLASLPFVQDNDPVTARRILAVGGILVAIGAVLFLLDYRVPAK